MPRYVLTLSTEKGEPLNKWPLVLLPTDRTQEGDLSLLVGPDREAFFDAITLDIISNEGLD